MSLAPLGLSRYLPVLGLAAILGACGGKAPGSDAARRQQPAASDDSLDPTSLGLSDLARTSRYVFRIMSRSDSRCGTRGLPPGRWEYTIGVEVRSGRVKGASLASVTLIRGGAAAQVPPANWPLALQAYVGCLRPKLLQTVMDPAPADGVYPTQFIAVGEAAPPADGPAPGAAPR